jgi:hypothetical protein
MKRWLRRLLRVLALGLALIVAVLCACLEGVDHRPYFRAPYYESTRARLNAALTNQAFVFGPLRAGFGKAILTPTLNAAQENPERGQFRSVPLAGYGNRRGRPATGVHDDLFVKAVAFCVGARTGVVVSADALIIPREVAEDASLRLEQELGLHREQVYFGATHTHASLGGWGEGMVAEAFAGGFQPGIRRWFATQLATAARLAVADLSPAAFGAGSFSAPAFVRNRLVGNLGGVDPAFDFALVKQTDGDLAVLGVYAAHATVLSDQVMEFSGDYPGAWQRAVERATGGIAMFLAGGVGSHSPVAGESGFAGVEKMGEALAQLTAQQLSTLPLTNQLAWGVLGLRVDLPELHVRLTDDWRLRPWLAKRLLRVQPQTYLQVFRLGNALWVSTPCDFSGELAVALKEHLRLRNQQAAITSFGGDYIGYVIPDRYYHLNSYESRLMSFFGPTVPDYFEELIRSLAGGLAEQ